MPLPYEEVYNRWQRSKSFGDPRDINQFSTDMNQVTGTNDFDVGAKAGWWTKASHAADVGFFHPIADYTGLTAAGKGIGGLFGEKGARLGSEIARGLPRMAAQTIPLIAAEVLSGGAATPLVVGGALASGGLFGAQTYAETGDPTAAAISGATAAAFPAAGRVGGAVGRAALGPSKWASLLGSEAALVGTQEASSALQAKHAGVPFDPLSPELWAQQIPFSLLDIGRTVLTKVPVRTKPTAPFPKTKEYVPPKAEPVEEANMQDMLDRMTNIAKDQNITPEEKTKAFEETLKVVMNPLEATAPRQDRVILIGHPQQMENGSVKLYGVASKYYDLPEHGNVFINNPESATQMINPDGSVTFITDRKNVSSNVKYPSRPEDFPALRQQKGQVQLPTEPIPPVEGGGINPETDLLSLRQKFHQVTGNKTMLDAMVAKEPKDPDAAVTYWQQAIEKMTPEHLKPGYESPFDAGEQAVMREAGVEPETVAPLEEERLVRPAVQTLDGKTFVGYLHADAWERAGSPEGGQYSDGWVTNKGRYLTKDQAAKEFPDSFDAAAADEIGSTDAWRGADVAESLTPEEEAATEPWTPAQMQEQTPKVIAQKIESAHATIADAQAKLDLVPKTSDDWYNSTIYHGTPYGKFEKFDLSKRGTATDANYGFGDWGNGVYFTRNREEAVNYAKQELNDPSLTSDPHVISAMVDLKNPLDLRKYHPDRAKSQLKGLEYNFAEDILGDLGDNWGDWDIGNKLKQAGYDGLISADGHELVVFDPEKIRILKTEKVIKEGATLTQAAETVRLQTQTPIVDQAKQQINLSQETLRDQMHEQLLALAEAAKPVPQEPLVDPKTGKPLTLETEHERELLRAAANKKLKEAGLPVEGVKVKEGAFPEKPQAEYDYANAIKDTNGKPFKTRALAEAFKEADPDLADYIVRDFGKKKGFVLAKQINKEASLEGAPGTSLENVIPAEDIGDTIAQEAATTEVVEPLEVGVFTPDAETRPEVSLGDYFKQLDLASKNPTRLRNAAGFDDLPTAITAIRQFRTYLSDVAPTGKTDLKSVNEALKKAGVLRFDSEKEMKDTFKKMRSGMEEFSGKYRSWSLDSKIPHDPELTQEIGILHPEKGAVNFFNWMLGNTPSGELKDLITGLRNTSDFSHVKITNEEGKGFWYQPKDNRLNLNRLPTDREDALNVWGPTVLTEFAHDTMRDLPIRVDPAAMEFKATLQRILRVVRDSKQLPAEVRKAVATAVKEDWYSKGAKHYNTKYDEHLPGRDSWKGVHYALLNEYELIGGIFDSPELRRILMNTTMPKSPVPILNFFAQAWARMFGYAPNAGNAFAKLLTSYDNYLSGSKNSRGYNGVSYIRDSLLADGVNPQQMASRINGVTEVYNKGDLSGSIKAFEREMIGPKPVEPNLVEPTEANKVALEKELLALPQNEREQIMTLQKRAADALQEVQQKGRQIGVPLAQLDREALAKSDRISDLWNKQGVTLDDEVAKYQKVLHEATGVTGNGLLPATTVAGPLNEAVKTALITGDAKAVTEATANLLANEVPQHQELWLRARNDLKIAKNLYDQAQKGNIFAELSLFQEGLKNQFAKLNAMKNELDRHNGAIARWNTMDSLGNSDGMQRLWSRSLKGEKTPEPTEQTGNEDIARQALGLEPKGAEYIATERRRLAATGEKALNPIERFFKFASYVSQELPAFKPIWQNMFESHAVANRRRTELEVVRNSDPRTQTWSKVIANANKRVAETEGLNEITSIMLRRANELEAGGQPVTLNDPEMQKALVRASDKKNRNGRSDRDDVITAFNSEGAMLQHRVDKLNAEHFDMANKGLAAIAIIGREIGMPSQKAIELGEQFYNTLKQLRDPAQQVQASEMLRQLSTQMQPTTFMKVLEQVNGFINDSEKQLKNLQRFRHYTGEQRYGNYHLVMNKEGEQYRFGFKTEKAARARAKELETDGWVLQDILPADKANIAGYLRADNPILESQRELDQQTLNRLETLISDLPLDRQEMLRPLVQRAADYQASAAAFSPVPTQASPRRKFRAGREELDMLANSQEETKRYINWMRHREARIVTAVHMLDPEMLANRGLRKYAMDFIDNQLTPDNPIARRLNEASFYWYLAGNFGNDVLESMQSLTTGMASVIAETGSVGDAVKYITNASGKVFRRYATGKWGDKETESFINWLSARGSVGLPSYGDIYDPISQNYFDVTTPKTTAGRTLDAIKHGLKGYKSLFIRHNDMVGALAGFQLGREMGMGFEDAARFAEGVKVRGLYTGGKTQRAVGMYNIKEKAVPQMMGAMKTYIQGFFSQLSHYYKVGFKGAPGEYTEAQRVGAKKAFMYMLGTQATLAGALGLPGIGQALALTKQTTGLDIKGWVRKNLASMFGEDQDDYGGFLTGLALHGFLSQSMPFDISSRQVNDIPFTGVSSWKGFDMSNLLPVPFSMASDFLGGVMALARGEDPSKAFPIALRGPVQLLHGGGDIRNSKGDLIYQLSPSERVSKALGLEPSRVSAAKETAATIKSMNDAAEARKAESVSAVATLYRKGDKTGAQRRMSEILKENPTYDPTRFVRSVAAAVEKQTMPYDWKREVNPALDIAGLANDQPSRELERLQLRQGVSQGLGLYERPNLRGSMRAASVDQLMNSDPYVTRSVALQRLLTGRQLRRRNISLEPQEYQ